MSASPAYFSFGPSLYSQAGEPYIQLADSVVGDLSRTAQKVVKVLLKGNAKGNNGDTFSQTNMMDKTIADEAGISRRRVQRALFELDKKLGFISRVREHGRRTITFLKKLIARPQESDRKPRRPKPSDPAASKSAEAVPSQILTPRVSSVVAALLDRLKGKGWKVVIHDADTIEAVPTRPEPQGLSFDDTEKLRDYKQAIRLMVESGRPARE
jgi:hypothetical protein